MQLLNETVKITRCLNAVAAGTTTQNGTAINMGSPGSDGILFVCSLGALTATQVTSLKAQQGLLADGSDAVDIAGATTGAAADADSNKLLILDVAKSKITMPYVRPVVVRGTANAVIDGVNAFQHSLRNSGVAQSGATISRSVNAV